MSTFWGEVRWQLTRLRWRLLPVIRCADCGHDTYLHGPWLAPGCEVRRCRCGLDWKGNAS